MHPGITVAVGHIQVARWGWHHLCRVVEGASGARYECPGTLAARIGMHPTIAIALYPSLHKSSTSSMARLEHSSRTHTVYSTITFFHHPKINGLRSTATISPC